MEVKLVLNNPKTGKSYKKELDGSFLIGLKVGDKVSGDSFELPGYEFEITGGSDNTGICMRKDFDSTGRKKALLTSGPGLNPKRDGIKLRKSIRGNTIGDDISQVNLKIIKAGSKDIEDLLGIKPEEPAAEEAPVEEKPAEEPKAEEAPKEEEKPAEEAASE